MRVRLIGWCLCAWGLWGWMGATVGWAQTPAKGASAPSSGMELLRKHACLSCHSTDGSKRLAPTLYRLWGQTRKVRTGPQVRDVVVDAAYVRRAILQPQADIVVGFESAPMPALQLSSADVSALIATIRTLGTTKTPPVAPAAPLWLLILLWGSACLFVFGHLGMSSLPVRGFLNARLGGRGFALLYSLVIAVAMGGLIYAWSQVRLTPIVLWVPPAWTRYIPFVTMPVVMYLWIAGFTSKNPASAGQEKTLDRGDAIQGIVKITRHPALWGFALWALVHLTTNGNLEELVFFGSFLGLAFLGMLHIDSRRKVALGEKWNEFAASTSLLPFGAVFRGRVRFSLRDIGWIYPLASIALYAISLLTHQWVMGRSPWPWG